MQPMTLERHADELRKVCQQLIPYSFSEVDANDEDLLPLKTRQIVVDGFDVSVNMSFAGLDKYRTESIQIQGVYTPFLPLYVVCKVARAFLGGKNLSCTDFVRDNRKVYTWIVRRRGTKSLRTTTKSSKGECEGFAYTILKPGHLNLYETKD